MTKIKPLHLDRKKGLYLKETATKGRGVFCTTNIRKGETLEITPAILLDDAATGHVDHTILLNYTFSVGKLGKKSMKQAKLDKQENVSCVVMGILSFCNHSRNPNAQVVWEEHDGSVYYTLQAIRAIPRHTEICTTYGEDWFKERKID